MDFNIGTCKKTSREFNGQNQIGDETEQNEHDILKTQRICENSRNNSGYKTIPELEPFPQKGFQW